MFETWDEAIAAYDDMLDEFSGEVVIGTLRYAASRVLREVDPIAYRCGLFDFLDGEDFNSDDLPGNCPV